MTEVTVAVVVVMRATGTRYASANDQFLTLQRRQILAMDQLDCLVHNSCIEKRLDACDTEYMAADRLGASGADCRNMARTAWTVSGGALTR